MYLVLVLSTPQLLNFRIVSLSQICIWVLLAQSSLAWFKLGQFFRGSRCTLAYVEELGPLFRNVRSLWKLPNHFAPVYYRSCSVSPLSCHVLLSWEGMLLLVGLLVLPKRFCAVVLHPVHGWRNWRAKQLWSRLRGLVFQRSAINKSWHFYFHITTFKREMPYYFM